MQPIEAERIDVGIFREDFREHIDEEIAVRAQQAQHPAVRVFLHVDLRNLGGIGRDSAPVGMVLVDLALKARRIDAQDANAELLVLSDVFLNPAERHVRAALLEQLAVVIGIEWVDEAHLTDGHAMRGRRGAAFGVHGRERIAAAGRLLYPLRDPDLTERRAESKGCFMITLSQIPGSSLRAEAEESQIRASHTMDKHAIDENRSMVVISQSHQLPHAISAIAEIQVEQTLAQHLNCVLVRAHGNLVLHELIVVLGQLIFQFGIVILLSR